MRALRGERAALLRDWQADIKARLWHLDKGLLTRKGKALQCAGETISALIDYHQFRAGPPQNGRLVLTTRTPEYATADAAPAALVAEAPESVNAETDTLFQANALRTAVTLVIAGVAPVWAALPIAWTDLRVLLDSLAAYTRRALALRGADADTLALSDGFLQTLIAAVAEQRIAHMEQQVAVQNEEALVTQHLAGRFLANASHELRTPLTAVLGFAELLAEETYGELTSEQRVAIGHIENSAQNLLEIVNNLLDLLHIRAGKLSLQYRPIEVVPLLRHLHDILTPLAERKNLTFLAELPDNLGAIEADENILRHIVYHLLSSALRATPAGGQVLLRAERDADRLTLTTHDTALHLPPEAIANMMDPFPRLENSPARGYEGWEVGLPLVRRYVDLHGGVLDLESVPEQGTTFRIALPTTRTARLTSDADAPN